MRKPYGAYGGLGVLILALLLGLLLAAAPAGAETRIAYTATLTYLEDDPENSPGYLWYDKKTAILVDRVEVFWIESSDPRLTGRMVGHLSSYGEGHFGDHGLFHPFWAIQYITRTIYIQGGGVWEGTGVATMDRKTGSTVTGKDNGVAGSVAGWQTTFTIRETWAGITESGFIIEP